MSIKSKLKGPVDSALDVAYRPVRSRRFHALFDEASRRGDVKVNIGSGGHPLPGWVNCDVAWRGESYLDATAPWPVPAGSVRFIYGDNVVEHLTLEQGRSLFRRTFDVLAPGGVLRLATPDVEAVARQYLDGGELAELGLERNRQRGRDLRYPVELLQQVYVGGKHYLGFIYDFNALGSEMEAAGFAVRRVSVGQSDSPELRGLESRLHPAEEATMLVVEGTKPS